MTEHTPVFLSSTAKRTLGLREAHNQPNASRNKIPHSIFRLAVTAMLVLTASASVRAQQSTQDLAVAAQNPIAAMYSLPFQNNIYGGAGPKHDATANVLNIQPVIPITVGDWNIISRTVAPLIYQPGPSIREP